MSQRWVFWLELKGVLSSARAAPDSIWTSPVGSGLSSFSPNVSSSQHEIVELEVLGFNPLIVFDYYNLFHGGACEGVQNIIF